MKTILLKLFLFFLFTQNTYSQCFEIESILVDACGGQEGFNEMVRFKVGGAPLNTATMNVNWPNNGWQGLVQNAVTATKVATLNTDILNAGGCGELIEPTGGILPANASVILVTSFNFDTTQNSFGALTEDIYIVFQNNATTTTGHFANFGAGLRTLTMTFGACFDVATYDRSLLVNPTGQNVSSDGATVLFTPSGLATYVNYGCSAPVQPFLVDINNPNITACPGDNISLTGTAEGHDFVEWTATSGNFNDATSLTTSYTIPSNASGSILVTLTATNSCGLTITDQVTITVSPSVTPDFPTSATYSLGATIPALSAVSPNGINGTWSPSVVSNTASGIYVFTPNPNQCATSIELVVTIIIDTPPTGNPLQIICFSENPTVSSLTANGTDILWYDTAVGGTPLDSSTPLVECQVYFASQTINGVESSERFAVSVTLIQTQITASATTICEGETVNLSVSETHFSIDEFTILDFSSDYNCNPSDTSFSGSTLLTGAQSGNFVFNGVPFYIHPWANALNSWSARYDSGPNPRSLTLQPDCNIITDFSLFANTYWGSPGMPALLNVEFYNNNQLVYVKDLIGDDDIRDFNNSAAFTSMINNVNTVNYWTSGNGNRRLDRINIPLPSPMAIDRIVINDFGDTMVQRVFVLATTVSNLQYNISYLWSTGDTTMDIAVTPSETTEYWVDVTVNGETCREFITINVTEDILPLFTQVDPICEGEFLAPLPTTSNNGITGSWSPTLNNLTTTIYTFTPDAGQCATETTMTIVVNTNVTPDFPTTLTFCSGDTVPNLNTTSPNGIVGTWNPSTINNTASGNYIFTPNTNECALPITLVVNVTTTIVPDFATTLTLCSGSTAPTLNTTSPNGIAGTWNPSTINTTTSGNYVFTPNANQCASQVTLIVTVDPILVPNFATNLTLCSGTTPPTLNPTSPNGIVGTWSPSTINTAASGNYVFTPNANQCASPITLTVTVNNPVTPDFATSLTLCSGTTAPTLNTTSPNGIIGTWNPSTINTITSGNYIFTPNTNECALPITLVVNVTTTIVPDFATTLTLCSGSTAPTLNTTSPNGIAGTWNPSTINTTTSGNYVFTPNANQCASQVTLIVTVDPILVPNFATNLTLCSGTTPPTLNPTSPNGIVGTWSPSTINTAASGNYVFTPNANQCASPITLTVTVNNPVTPDFATSLTLCSGTTAPTLNTTSPNGIIGTWNPSTINNTASGNYIFTPNTNECALPITLVVNVTTTIVPDFATTLTLCSGSTAPTLNTTSPNGIAGTWNPSTINTTTSGNYVFTPNANQCASQVTLIVTVDPILVPNFATNLTLCSGTTPPTLNPTSPNGIVGTWSPSTINTAASGNYVFTPNANQCASPITLTVTVNNPVTPDFATSLTLCSGTTAPTLNTTSPNGIIGTWNPSTINTITSGNYVFTPNTTECALPITLTVTVNTIAVSITGVDTLCVGESTQWTSSITGGTWSISDTNIATIDSNGNITAIGSGITTINYFLQGSCDTTVSETIEVTNLPEPILTDSYVCVDNLTGEILAPILLESGLSNTNYTFVWTLDGDVLPTTQNNHLATATGLYTVTATHTITGCSGSSSATVSASSIAIGSATVGQDFDQNQVITVTVTGGSGDYEYILNNGPIQSSNYFTNVLQGENVIIVRDKNGCGELVLTVYSLNYPYFFTPNGDGFNDTWNISGLENQPTSLIYIFDRYGKLLKTLKASGGNGWDGTYNGENMPSTDYWFTLLYTNNDGFEKEFKAHFSLKR
ncbi:MAG TPA: T9SS type B sorting domain-containing protein [Flavobacterium sp.]|uniref:T9SS type B sorting domain-containing protein n=1 Tax=Flavobacterium sp. TaxID=239 RepID=UPI002B540579|nr:T9SS type B sorting domain-containing protein [Flavobacterium sp.]HRE78431.1 T9SS type B sorting domain-containing protein [Flavobacterium sp.]